MDLESMRHRHSWLSCFAVPTLLKKSSNTCKHSVTVKRRVFYHSSTTCCVQVVLKSVEEARLARFLAADWSNENQAIENPPFWSHMRVSYRPLPFELLDGFSLYSESCYQAFMKQPYRTGVYRIVTRNDGKLELELYKIEGEEEFYQGSRNIEKLRSLTRERLVKLPSCCNTILSWNESEQMFSGETVPGKLCIVHRKGQETYLHNSVTVSKEKLTSWDTGRCPKTDKLLWGAIAGPFEFYPVARFSHEVDD
ncbi:hypothetical protein GpartN1_g893.t1 [Galdieria partita]|uniref:Uncharacterized protein n=1 Tax=Galdieria partita TaxID=83374 RepID=A0A9C7PSZ0_9RHOD|nr:hypothetical protein GpartN1_g893.t1 [Galdieria partita]